MIGSRPLIGPLERKYTVPAAVGFKTVQSKPKINGGRMFVVEHTEYLQDIYVANEAVAGFVPVRYTIQPGLTDSFPWLGTVASNFEQYRIVYMTFHYRPRVSTSTDGQVLMCTQLDSADGPFTSKDQMLGYTGCTRSNVWRPQDHRCEIKKGDYMKKYFISTTYPTTDLQQYNVGTFNIICIGGTADAYRGDLEVSYRVELYNPKINTAIPPAFGLVWNYTGNADSPMATKDTAYSADVVPKAGYVDVSSGSGSVDLKFDEPGAYTVQASFYNNDSTIPADFEFLGVAFSDFIELFEVASTAVITSAYETLMVGFVVSVLAAAKVVTMQFAGASTNLYSNLNIQAMSLGEIGNLHPYSDFKFKSQRNKDAFLGMVPRTFHHKWINVPVHTEKITKIFPKGHKSERKQENKENKAEERKRAVSREPRKP